MAERGGERSAAAGAQDGAKRKRKGSVSPNSGLCSRRLQVGALLPPPISFRQFRIWAAGGRGVRARRVGVGGRERARVRAQGEGERVGSLMIPRRPEEESEDGNPGVVERRRVAVAGGERGRVAAGERVISDEESGSERESEGRDEGKARSKGKKKSKRESSVESEVASDGEKSESGC